MKKILTILCLVASLSVYAADFTSSSLLSGSNLRVLDSVTATTTLAPGATNVYYAKPDGTTYTYSFTSTNILLDVTNAVTGAGTNRTVVNTNVVSQGAFAEAPVTSLDDGNVNPNATISATFKASAAAQTNTITIAFERSADGMGYDGSNPVLSIALTCNSPTSTTYVTNVPSAFLTGIRAVRVKSITTDDHASNGTNILEKLSFNQWRP